MMPDPVVNLTAPQPDVTIEIKVSGDSSDPESIVRTVLNRMEFTVDEDGYLCLNK